MNDVPTPMPGALPANYRGAIERAVTDPTFDVEKLERLIAVQEAVEMRAADHSFNVAHSVVQGELSAISADCSNPSTRSRYASYTALDRAVRPLYTKHGFAVSFTTEPISDNAVLVVAHLTNGMTIRRYQVPCPIDTKGARGTDYMTRMHATLSAVSYGKRHLLAMMFNLAVESDAAKSGPVGDRTKFQQQPPPAPPPGVPESDAPFVVEWLDADKPRDWGSKLLSCLRAYCHTQRDVDAFLVANDVPLKRMEAEAQATHRLLLEATAELRKELPA
jgi:ERF superfamily